MGMMVTKKQSSVHLVWFKRDLRLSDHKPLLAAAGTGLPVLPLYVVEPDYWAQPFASRRQWAFIQDCLHELRDNTARSGQPLCVRTGSVTDVLSKLEERYERYLSEPEYDVKKQHETQLSVLTSGLENLILER